MDIETISSQIEKRVKEINSTQNKQINIEIQKTTEKTRMIFSDSEQIKEIVHEVITSPDYLNISFENIHISEVPEHQKEDGFPERKDKTILIINYN